MYLPCLKINLLPPNLFLTMMIRTLMMKEGTRRPRAREARRVTSANPDAISTH
jgi:hypothetical protein